MPTELPKAQLEAAQNAVEYAALVRKTHRRKTQKGHTQREADISIALARLKRAMAGIRPLIGQFPYGPQTAVAEANREQIRAASRAIQAERRKLWKMQQRNVK